MTEAEAPDRARVVARHDLLDVLVGIDFLFLGDGLLLDVLLVLRAFRELHDVPVAVAVLGFILVPGDELGEHPGERVDLVPAELGPGGEPRRPVGQHALEAEHERVVHLPLGRRGAPARVHLEERGIERPPACDAFGEHVCGVLAGMEEGLA